MPDLPFISCICPTFNRPSINCLWLLEECVESFLRQDYAGPKELLILNDTPGQELRCDAPQVRILNIPGRCSSLGHKYNLLCSLSRGDFIAPWEDDDISLPDRLSRSVAALGDYEAYNPKGYFFAAYRRTPDTPREVSLQRIHTEHPIGVCHNCSLFSRTLWSHVGGYPQISGAQDAEMDTRLQKSGRMVPVRLTEKTEWTYIYRWGVQPMHLSGVSPHDEFYVRVGQSPVTPGVFEIHPHWEEDYVALTRQTLRPSPEDRPAQEKTPRSTS